MQIKRLGYLLVCVFLGSDIVTNAQSVPPAATLPQTATPSAPQAQSSPDSISPTSTGTSAPNGVPSSVPKADDPTQASPDTSAFSWRGTPFDVGGSLIARARFEKFLNEPESTQDAAKQYNAILRDISEILAGKGGEGDQQRIVKAWRLLYQASTFDVVLLPAGSRIKKS